MLAANIPPFFPIPFASSAGAGFIRTIPTASQIPTTPGAASLTDGFPPLNFLPVSAGGVPPFGQDVNGILNEVTANVQWENAGGTFPYNSAFSTAIGGYPAGALLRRTDGTGYWFSTTDNNVTNPDAGGAGWLGIFAGSPGAARVQGLIGVNNATTPNTQFDFSALGVTLRNPTTGATAVATNTGLITNNVLTAGPVANGRDQSAAFTASQWLRFYFIWNPTTSTLATISSAAAPGVGPTLPSGYTHWAYIGSVYFTSGSALTLGNFRGSWFNFSVLTTALNGGTSTSLVAVPIPTLVPAEAIQFELLVQNIAITSTAGGAYSVSAIIVTQASSIFSYGLQGGGSASTIAGVSGPSKRIANFSQSFAYALTASAGTGPTTTINIGGYSVPNGGE